MIDIRLTEDYRITSDPLNYILQKRRIVQDKDSNNYGKEYWDSISWHGNLEGLVDKLISLELKSSEVKRIEDLIKIVYKIKDEIFKELEKHGQANRTN